MNFQDYRSRVRFSEEAQGGCSFVDRFMAQPGIVRPRGQQPCRLDLEYIVTSI